MIDDSEAKSGKWRNRKAMFAFLNLLANQFDASAKGSKDDIAEVVVSELILKIRLAGNFIKY